MFVKKERKLTREKVKMKVKENKKEMKYFVFPLYFLVSWIEKK